MIKIRAVHQTLVLSFVLLCTVSSESAEDVFYHSDSVSQEPTTQQENTPRPRKRGSRRTTASTRAYFTYTHKFFPEPEFCDELLPISYKEILPGDPPNLVEMEWSTNELLTVSIVGSPFTRSTGFLVQGRLRNTTTPVGMFPGKQDATIYDCPPGKLNTIRKQIADSNYFYSIIWKRPLDVSIENITFAVSVLKPFDRWYQKTFDLPPFPDRYVSAEITTKDKTATRKTRRPVLRDKKVNVNRTKRLTKDQKRLKRIFQIAGVRWDGGTNLFL